MFRGRRVTPGTIYWFYGYDDNGKLITGGPCYSESEATMRAQKLSDGDTAQIDTKNHAEANRRLKSILLQKSSNGYTHQRAKHLLGSGPRLLGEDPDKIVFTDSKSEGL